MKLYVSKVPKGNLISLASKQVVSDETALKICWSTSVGENQCSDLHEFFPYARQLCTGSLIRIPVQKYALCGCIGVCFVFVLCGRAVSKSYIRGAQIAVLVYDLCSTFGIL